VFAEVVFEIGGLCWNGFGRSVVKKSDLSEVVLVFALGMRERELEINNWLPSELQILKVINTRVEI